MDQIPFYLTDLKIAGAQFFTLTFEASKALPLGDTYEMPAMDEDGRILVFRKKEHIQQALSECSTGIRALPLHLEERVIIYNFDDYYYDLHHAADVNSDDLLHGLFLLTDFVEYLPFQPTQTHEDALRDLCLHLSVNWNLNIFFEESRFSREFCLEAYTVYIGAWILHSRVIQE